MSNIDESIQYKSIAYYIIKIREADSPLGILINVDYLTDLIDMELEEIKNKNKKQKEKRNERFIRNGSKRF